MRLFYEAYYCTEYSTEQDETRDSPKPNKFMS